MIWSPIFDFGIITPLSMSISELTSVRETNKEKIIFLKAIWENFILKYLKECR